MLNLHFGCGFGTRSTLPTKLNPTCSNHTTMKKTLLSLLLFLPFISQGQIILFVEEPEAISGNYPIGWAENGWGIDMMDPDNAITAPLAMAYDATDADSLNCEPTVNGSEVAGKIAVVYRGDCEFGQKASNVQSAGAIGMIIINNVAGDPFNPGGGVFGEGVTIPVVMVSDLNGQILRSAMETDEVIAFIGNKTGFYENDWGMYKNHVLAPPSTAIPADLAQNANEFSVPIGSWVFNFGSNAQTEVALSATVVRDGDVLYEESSNPTFLAAGDSIYITLPAFSQPSYSGYYEITLEATNGQVEDEFPADNTFVSGVLVDSLFTYARVDPATKNPISGAHFRPANSLVGYTACIHFRDANASRMAATGLIISATSSADSPITDHFVNVYAFEWGDEFIGIDDITGVNLFDLAEGEHFFDSEDEAGVPIYVPFFQPVPLSNNQRYLFCVESFSNEVFLGFDTYYDYEQHQEVYDQPISMINNDNTWFLLGFGTDATCAVGVKMADANVGIAENGQQLEITPYPNPTADILRIPMPGINGTAQLDVFDMQGRLVSGERMGVAANETMVVDVNGLAAGTYLFMLRFDDGSQGSFRVMVTR
jgi:hypothetical protein